MFTTGCRLSGGSFALDFAELPPPLGRSEEHQPAAAPPPPPPRLPVTFVGVFPQMGSRGASEHDNIMSLLMTVFSQAGGKAIING